MLAPVNAPVHRGLAGLYPGSLPILGQPAGTHDRSRSEAVSPSGRGPAEQPGAALQGGKETFLRDRFERGVVTAALTGRVRVVALVDRPGDAVEPACAGRADLVPGERRATVDEGEAERAGPTTDHFREHVSGLVAG